MICKWKITLKNEHIVLCKKTVIQVNLNHDLFLNLFKDVHRDYDKSIPCFHNRTCWPCLLRHHQFWKESWYHQSNGVLLVKVRYWRTRAVHVRVLAGDVVELCRFSDWSVRGVRVNAVCSLYRRRHRRWSDRIMPDTVTLEETHKRLFERCN